MTAIQRAGRAGLVVTLLAVLLAAGRASPVAAQGREHCGTIASNEIWTAASSPHSVRCTVTVRNSTLTIQPGVRVLMGEGTSLVIEKGSSLQAVGSQEEGQIYFTGLEDRAGYWSQILFKPGANQSRMNFVSLMSGGHEGVPMVEVQGGPVLMNNMDFRLAGGMPLSFTAEMLGPSLDAPGQATVGRQCNLIVLRGRQNTIEAIEIQADAELDVTESQTWHYFCVPYRVVGTITVAGSEEPTLSVDRGAIFQFDGDGGLVVGRDEANRGGFEANGTLDEPVVLTGLRPERGSWNGVELTRYSTVNSLFNTRVEYGGRGDRPMLIVRGPETYALELQLAHAQKYPLALLPDAVGSFVSALGTTENPVFVDNGVNRILVMADEQAPDIAGPTRWTDIGADYEIEGTLTVASESQLAELVIEAGRRPSPELRLAFSEGAALVIGHPDWGAGALRVTGFITKPVVFSGVAEQPGAWRGIRLTDQAERGVMEHVVVEYGGAGGEPMVDWGDVGGYVRHATLRGAAGYPFTIDLARAEVVMGEDQSEVEYRHRVEGNGVERILVRSNGPLTKSRVVWASPGAPVEFDGEVVIASPQTPLIELRDGLALLFREGAHLQLGLGAGSRAAMQVANLDPELPVTMAAVDPAAGWGGMRILTASTLNGRDLVLQDVADGSANLLVDGGAAVVRGLTLKGAGRGVGLELTGAGGRAELTGGRITGYRVGVHTADGARLTMSRFKLDGNLEWGVLNEDPTLCQMATLVYWGAPTGPLDESEAEDGCMNAANDSPGAQRTSDHVKWWPYAIDTSFTPSPGLGPNPWQVFLPWVLRGHQLP